MSQLAANAVLAAWESAQDARGHRRALALLDPIVAELGARGVTASTLPLGRRDALLLTLYRDIRGPQLDTLAECPECESTLEVQLSIEELIAGYDEPPEPGTRIVDVDLDNASVRTSCPSTADLIAASAAATVTEARTTLIERCIRSVRRPDDSDTPLTADELERLGAELEVLDPLVDVRIEIECAECGHAWSAFLDVPTLVLAQTKGHARQLLKEVDALAARYGWAEQDILAMSARRRLAYLDLP
jgi:hypothetical protein